MTKIEIDVIPVVSTAHLTEAEANAPGDSYPTYTLTGECGLLSYCAFPEEWSEEQREEFPNLAKVGIWAACHGWAFVRFDRDGPEVEGLEVFNW